MAIVAIDLALADATLADGAQLKATGGGYPDRLMPEDEYHFDAAVTNGICFGNDDETILAVSGGAVRKYDFAGNVVWTIAGVTNAHGIWRVSSSILYVARNAAIGEYWEIDEDLQTATPRTQPTNSTRQIVVVPGGTADRAWGITGGNTATEFVISTGLASGRTITAPSGNFVALHAGLDESAVPCLWFLPSGTTTILKYRESDLALLTTWTINGRSPLPGGAGITAFTVGPDARPLTYNSGGGGIDRLNLTGGDQRDVAERMVWAAGDIGGPGTPNQAQTAFPITFSSDGRYVAYLANNAAGTTDTGGVRVKNLLEQRVEWSVALDGHTSWKGAEFYGNLDSSLGPTTGWRVGNTNDFRRARPYYRRVGLDGADVFQQEFGIPVAGLSLVGATALVVGIEFTCGLGKLGGPLPYLGGPNGEGPRLWVEDGQEDVDPPPVLGGAVTSTTWEAIHDNWEPLLKAIAPARAGNLRFDRVKGERLEVLAQRQPTVEVFRKFEFLSDGSEDDQDAGECEPNAILRTLHVTLQVAYPVLEELFGDDWKVFEAILREDAAALRDVLLNSDNWLAGQGPVFVSILAPRRDGERLFFQELGLEVRFYEAQNIYGG